MIYFGFFHSDTMKYQDTDVLISIDPRVPEDRVNETFKPFYPSLKLLEWYSSMLEKDKEVKDTFAQEYATQIAEYPLDNFLRTIEASHLDQRVVLLGYDESEAVNCVTVLLKILKKLKYPVELYDSNRLLYDLTKKESTAFRDFFVKLRRVYSKDVYVFGSRYIVPGEESQQDLSGTLMCEANDEYIPILQKVFGKKHVFIPNIDEIKNNYGLFSECSEPEHEKYWKYVSDFDDFGEVMFPVRFHEDEETNQTIMKQVFEEKLIAAIEDPHNQTPSVLVGSSFLPLVTIDNVKDLFFYMDEFVETKTANVFQLKLWFNFTHFRYKARYLYL